MLKIKISRFSSSNVFFPHAEGAEYAPSITLTHAVCYGHLESPYWSKACHNFFSCLAVT